MTGAKASGDPVVQAMRVDYCGMSIGRDLAKPVDVCERILGSPEFWIWKDRVITGKSLKRSVFLTIDGVLGVRDRRRIMTIFIPRLHARIPQTRRRSLKRIVRVKHEGLWRLVHH